MVPAPADTFAMLTTAGTRDTRLEGAFCCEQVCQSLSQPVLKTLHARRGLLLAEYIKVELQTSTGFIIAYCINPDATTEHAVCSDFIKIKR